MQDQSAETIIKEKNIEIAQLQAKLKQLEEVHLSEKKQMGDELKKMKMDLDESQDMQRKNSRVIVDFQTELKKSQKREEISKIQVDEMSKAFESKILEMDLKLRQQSAKNQKVATCDNSMQTEVEDEEMIELPTVIQVQESSEMMDAEAFDAENLEQLESLRHQLTIVMSENEEMKEKLALFDEVRMQVSILIKEHDSQKEMIRDKDEKNEKLIADVFELKQKNSLSLLENQKLQDEFNKLEEESYAFNMIENTFREILCRATGDEKFLTMELGAIKETWDDERKTLIAKRKRPKM